MTESKCDRRSRRLAVKNRDALSASVATRRVSTLRRTCGQISSSHNLRHRIDGRIASPYQYTPLDEDLKEIRLMTLHEGDFDSEIKVSLRTVPLKPHRPPKYEALSYVWGSLKDPIDIQVGVGTLAITRNLAEALPYLRYKNKPRILWIDAICVNQRDLKERGHQVKRMANLYELADRVVVWLGPARNNSGQGTIILDHLSSQIEVDWDTRVIMKPASAESEPDWIDEAEQLPYGEKELFAISGLLCRQWFERLWVQQEIRLAKSNCVFLCGPDMIAWQSLRKAILCLSLKEWSTDSEEEDLPLLGRLLRDKVSFLMYLVRSERTTGFLEIMSETRRSRCFDPRDRVYAILSLLDQSEMPSNIEPDYGKTTIQVYQDVTLRYITHHKKLDILQASGLKAMPLRMPTWVPDRTVKNEAEYF